MGRQQAVLRLLKHDADVNGVTKTGLTPLHLAVMRQQVEIVSALLEQGADEKVKDNNGRSALDWAALRNNKTLVELLSGGVKNRSTLELGLEHPTQLEGFGRLLDQNGLPLDGKPALRFTEPQTKEPLLAPEQHEILETGIRIVDVLAPLARGGMNGLFTPRPNLGMFVLIQELVASLSALHGGFTVLVGLEDENYSGRSLMLSLREWGVAEQALLVFSQSSSFQEQVHAIHTATTAARYARQAGGEVLMMIDSRIAQVVSPTEILAGCDNPTSGAQISLIFYGGESIGAEPEYLQGLDAAITFDPERARRSLWPAVDPLRSYSHHLPAGSKQANLVEQTRRILQGGQGSQVEQLDVFFTQAFSGAEPWTAIPGERTRLQQALDELERLLENTSSNSQVSN